MTQKTLMDGKVWLALKARLEQFTDCPVHMPMKTYKPTASDRFVIVQQVALDGGDNLPLTPACGVQYRGFLSLGVCVPTDYEFAVLLGLAGAVSDHFPNGAKYTYQDAIVTVSGRAKVSGAVSLQASWNRIEVTVPWSAWG